MDGRGVGGGGSEEEGEISHTGKNAQPILS